jgi:hypothetical protein
MATNQQLTPGKQNYHDTRHVEALSQLDYILDNARQFVINLETTDVAAGIIGFFGGVVPGSGSGPVTVAGFTKTLAGSATHRIEVDVETGATSVSTGAWSGGTKRAVAEAVTVSGEITSIVPKVGLF